MSIQRDPSSAPEWDLADRLRKALRHCGLSVQEMADHLGLKRGQVSKYLNGRTKPRRSVLIAWAMRCGVPFEWLALGVEPGTPPDLGVPTSGCNEDWPWSPDETVPMADVVRLPQRVRFEPAAA